MWHKAYSQRFVRFKLSNDKNLSLPLLGEGLNGIAPPADTLWYDFYTQYWYYDDEDKPQYIRNNPMYEQQSFYVGHWYTTDELLASKIPSEAQRVRLLSQPEQKLFVRSVDSLIMLPGPNFVGVSPEELWGPSPNKSRR